MNSLSSAVKQLVYDLEQLNVDFAFVGALAIGAHGRTRQTIDADVAITLQDISLAQKLVDDLVLKGYGINNIYKNNSNIALARLFARESIVEIDLLFDLCGIEKEVVNTAESLEIWQDCKAPIATISSLLAMKARCQDLPERIQDKADLITQLIPAASESDLEKARNLISLMEKRGYNEDREILVSFNKLVQSLNPSN